MPRGTHERTPEQNAVMSEIKKNSKAAKAATDAQRGVPLSQEHCDAIKMGLEESGVFDRMRGGDDIVNHHYIYDHSDLSKYTMEVTRSKHGQIHAWLKKANIIIPHINIKE